MSKTTLDPILQNHLLFMRRHRGDFFVSESSVIIASEAPGFTGWIPLKEDAQVPDELPSARLVPRSGSGWPAKLELAGFREAESLSYQQFKIDGQFRNQCAEPTHTIERAVTRDDALTFAEVQAAGFLEQNGDGAEWWSLFFKAVALRNLYDDDQDLLIARENDQAQAILLMISGAGVSGIYAVATRPEARNRGFSTALLAAAAKVARRRRSGLLVLQAMVGSYADGFYKRLGFNELYVSQVWRR